MSTILSTQNTDSTTHLEFWYPGIDRGDGTTHSNRLQIELYHVRAADDIIVSYDFERDGWVISKARYDDETGEHIEDVEKAFIPAWDAVE